MPCTNPVPSRRGGLAPIVVTAVAAARSLPLIQRVRPKVLLLNEFDYEPDGALVDAFQENYLAVAQADDLEPIEYAYTYTALSKHRRSIGLRPRQRRRGRDRARR